MKKLFKKQYIALCISFMHSYELCAVQFPFTVWMITKSEKMPTTFFGNYCFLCFFVNGGWFVLPPNNQMWKTLTGFKLYSFCCIYFCKHWSYPGPLILLRKAIHLYSQIVNLCIWKGKKMKEQWSMSITLNMTLCYKETKEEPFFKEQLGQKLKGCSETLCWHDIVPW